MKIIEKNGLKISSIMFDFVNNEAIPETGLDPDQFWAKFSEVVHEMAPTNKYLIEKRETIQKKIDDWHKSNKGKEFDKFWNTLNFQDSMGQPGKASLKTSQEVTSLKRKIPLLGTLQWSKCIGM